MVTPKVMLQNQYSVRSKLSYTYLHRLVRRGNLTSALLPSEWLMQFYLNLDDLGKIVSGRVSRN